MTLFAVLAAALTALAVWIVARAPRRPGGAAASGAPQANVDALRSQLRQLDDDLAAGTIDPPAHALAREEVERRLLDEARDAEPAVTASASRATRWALLAGLPLVAVALYAVLGSPAALAPGATRAQAEPTPADVEAMVAKLAERMEKQPPGRIEDLEGWVMLGRSYAVLQRYPEASRAFARAIELAPDDAQLLVDQADVLAMAHGQSLQGEPQRLIDRALQIDPKNPKALALAGSAAFERKDYAAAVAYWERARPFAAADSEFARGLDGSIAEARALGGITGAPGSAVGGNATGEAGAASGGTAAVAGGAAQATAAGAGASVRGRVALAPELASRVAPTDTVFVFARAAEGPRMPLAIVKRPASDLPFDFTLDDAQAMAPELKLSAHPQVIVGVRVSKTGDAMPKSGDLEGQAGPLPNRSDKVELKIDRVRP